MSRVTSFIRAVLVVGLSFLVIACNPGLPVEAATADDSAPSTSNQPPIMADQTLAGLAFATTVQDTISFSDADSSSFTLVVTAQGLQGTVTITDATTGAFDYALSSADALNGDSFTVELSDSTSTVSAVITLAFTDATAPVVAFSPLDAATNVALSTNLVLTSDDPLDSATVSVQSTPGTCGGSIQLSDDDFTSCLALNAPTISDFARTVTVTPTFTLTDNTPYKLRATTTLTNRFSTAAAATEQSFTTLDIDQPPVMADQTLAGLAFTTTVQDTISFSDADSSSFTLVVTAQGLQGTVTITDANTGAFDYALSSADALNGDSFTVDLGDGTSTVSAVITLAFADATAPVVEFTPLNNATDVAIATNLVLTSDDPLNSASVSVQSSDGACSGSLQLSDDNFTSCLALTGLTVTNLARTVTLTPAMTLADNTLYKLRATATLSNRFSTATAATEQSFTTLDIDQPPVMADQTLAGLAFATTVQDTISFSDADSSSVTLVVTAQGLQGTVTITDANTGAFDYALSSSDALNGDSFAVQVSDGSSTVSAVITLAFADTTAPVVAFTPLDTATNVAVATDLVLTSDDPLDSATLSVQGTPGTCGGSIQLSDDDFTSCLALNAPTISDFARTVTVTPTATLTENTTYKLRATSTLSNRFATTTAATEQSFTTVEYGYLMINEVGSNFYVNALRWFELYNGTGATINVADYTFRSYAVTNPGFTVADATFALPNQNILPGQYLVVRSQDFNQTFADNNQVVYIKNGSDFPFWSTDGYIELIHTATSDTVDYVKFGQNYTPTDANAWSGAQTTLVSTDSSFGQSIGRDASHSDTNTAADWTAYNPGTFGSVNDVECATDADFDMIPDCNEVAGKTFAGMPLHDWGARPGVTDIFIEIDYMDSLDEGITPRKEALDSVVAAFAAHNIAIHFDVGDLYDQVSGSLDPLDYDLGGGQQVPFVNGMSFSPVDGRADFYDYKDSYFSYDRLQFFHYLIFANSQKLDGSSDSSGLAELEGNDIIVSLGNWGLSAAGNLNKLINYQAATLMHELGHNLGLHHGGNESTNYKPNYLSVMNYTYNLRGLPTIGTNEGDRMHEEEADACTTPLINGPSDSYVSFSMDFSDNSSISLDETSLNETLGFGRTGSQAVDFNCNNGATETTLSADINKDSNANGLLTDHNDWANLVTDFGGLSNLTIDGAQLTEQIDTPYIVWPVRVQYDRMPYIVETLYKPK